MGEHHTVHSSMKKSAAAQAELPPGWNEDRVHRVLTHYERQTEDEAVAEDETQLERRRPARIMDRRHLACTRKSRDSKRQ